MRQKQIQVLYYAALWLGISAIVGLAGGLIAGVIAARHTTPAQPGLQPTADATAASNRENDSGSKSGSDTLAPVPAISSAPAIQSFLASSVPTENRRPRLHPTPAVTEQWACEVVVVGGSLGGLAAATHAMQAGAQTCLIESSPWIGGQISAQGVSAIDESWLVRQTQNISPSWANLLNHLRNAEFTLPPWAGGTTRAVADLNSCWVGQLCFPSSVGAEVAETLLREAANQAPDSRWASATAFKGAEFDEAGDTITTVYAVQRTPKSSDYRPLGKLWQELPQWYSWSDDETFAKTAIALRAPPGKTMTVIDATDTGELIAWAKIPHRQGSESRQTTGEPNASAKDNPQCTQAFTFPFALALRDDQGASLKALAQVDAEYNEEEHYREYSLRHFPMFSGRSFFNYRRMISVTQNSATQGTPVLGDVTLVNWNPGNDWNWMDPPLILVPDQLQASRQYNNWMGGLSVTALRHGHSHALLFSRWLMETQAQPGFPLSHWSGVDSPMGTQSGLSMVPYIREGRRILGRSAYGQEAFMLSEFDIRLGFAGRRNVSPTSVAVAHYDVDIHGCRYRNWTPSWEATSAPTHERNVRPILIPIESLVPQGVDNVLVGGKALAVTHIVNAVTRIHNGEWAIGGAAGAIAGWLAVEAPAALDPPSIVSAGYMSDLQTYLNGEGLQTQW